jgi:hypothetical protein
VRISLPAKTDWCSGQLLRCTLYIEGKVRGAKGLGAKGLAANGNWIVLA